MCDPSVAPPPGTHTATGWTPKRQRREHATLRRATTHGVRPFDDGGFYGTHGYVGSGWPDGTNAYRRRGGVERPATSL